MAEQKEKGKQVYITGEVRRNFDTVKADLAKDTGFSLNDSQVIEWLLNQLKR